MKKIRWGWVIGMSFNGLSTVLLLEYVLLEHGWAGVFSMVVVLLIAGTIWACHAELSIGKDQRRV